MHMEGDCFWEFHNKGFVFESWPGRKGGGGGGGGGGGVVWGGRMPEISVSRTL